jgi:hypothetical protein
MSKQEYEWFLEPQSAQSNEIISREVSEDDFYRAVTCKDGMRRDLWMVSYSLAKFFWQSRSSGIEIKVFCRAINKGTSRGKAKDMTFLFRNKFSKRLKQKTA